MTRAGMGVRMPARVLAERWSVSCTYIVMAYIVMASVVMA